MKNIVLIHGAFADGTSWAKVIPILAGHAAFTLSPFKTR